MFCSTCGETLQTSFKFCPKCGKDLRNTLEQKPVEQKKDKDVSFKEFKAAKEKQRATFFRSKPDKKGKSAGGKREDMDQSVKINVGIMVHDSQGRELTVRRGKGLPVSVPKNCTAEMLLKAATDKHKAHSKDVIKPQFKSTLEKFIAEEATSSSGDESGSGVEEVNLPTKRKRTSTLEKQDFDDNLPSMLHPDTSHIDAEAQLDSAIVNNPSGISHRDAEAQEDLVVNNVPNCNLSTLRDMFPNTEDYLLKRALSKTNGDISLAISDILKGRSAELTSLLSPQGIYASLNFCNDVIGDQEFEEGAPDIPCTSSYDDEQVEGHSQLHLRT